MSVRGKVKVQFYLSKSVHEAVERYITEHYPSLNVRSAFFEDAIRNYLEYSHTHKKSYLKQPWSRIDRIIRAIRDDGYDREIDLSHLRKLIIREIGEDARTIAKYMGEWDEVRVPDSLDPSNPLIRYVRHVQKRKESKKPVIGVLFERGFLDEGINDEGLRGINRFGINWKAVDEFLRPKSLKEEGN